MKQREVAIPPERKVYIVTAVERLLKLYEATKSRKDPEDRKVEKQPAKKPLPQSTFLCKVVGLTPTGRTTVATLRLNRPLILAIRAEEAVRGRHPPRR